MKLKEAQTKFQVLLDEAKTLEAKETRTDDEQATLVAKIAEGKGLATIIKQLQEQEADFKSLVDFDSEPAEKRTAVKIDGLDGEAILRGSVVQELTGFGLTEKAARAILEPVYKDAFRRFLVGKDDVADLKSLSEGIDPAGGYLVPPDIRSEIIKRDAHPTRYLDFIDSIPTTSDVLKYPSLIYTTDDIYDNPIRIAWTGENGTTDDATDTEWGEIAIQVFTGTFGIEFSRDLRDDTPLALESIIRELAVDSYKLGMEQVHIAGDGAGKPLGITANAGATGGVDIVNIGATLGAATAGALVTAVHTLPEQYADNCQGFTNRATFGAFCGLSDGSNNLINLFGVRETTNGLSQPRVTQLLGYDLYRTAFLSSPGSANLIGIFGNVRKAYKRVQRLIMSAEPYGLQDKTMLRANKMGIHFRFREGGRTVQPRAAHIWRQS